MAIANGTCVNFCNQPKAHFGLPCVRPWDNRGKCHMAFNAPVGVFPLEFREKFGPQKLESWSYHRQ